MNRLLLLGGAALPLLFAGCATYGDEGYYGSTYDNPYYYGDAYDATGVVVVGGVHHYPYGYHSGYGYSHHGWAHSNHGYVHAAAAPHTHAAPHSGGHGGHPH